MKNHSLFDNISIITGSPELSEVSINIFQKKPELKKEFIDQATKILDKSLSLENFWQKVDLVYLNFYLTRKNIMDYLKSNNENLNSPRVKKFFPQKWAVDKNGTKIRKVEYWEMLNPDEETLYE